MFMYLFQYMHAFETHFCVHICFSPSFPPFIPSKSSFSIFSTKILHIRKRVFKIHNLFVAPYAQNCALSYTLTNLLTNLVN